MHKSASFCLHKIHFNNMIRKESVFTPVEYLYHWVISNALSVLSRAFSRFFKSLYLSRKKCNLFFFISSCGNERSKKKGIYSPNSIKTHSSEISTFSLEQSCRIFYTRRAVVYMYILTN